MSVKVKYKGEQILSLNTDTEKALATEGQYCEGDITIENVQDGGITPSGTIEITENDTYDVTAFASALVNVSGGGSLPSSISKIDGGSFTLPATKAPEDYWITHSLGAAPKGYAIWADSRPPCNGVDAVSYGFVIINGNPGSGHVGYYFYNKLWHDQPSSENDLKGWITNAASYADTTRLRMWESTAKYEAGVTYNWLAWA